MNFGFVIDNRTCIGCHACSTACKAENDVPLGVHRTWVKYVEKGTFPNVRRHFQVTRCNHCANPPCVRICPVEAMFQRADGIVDFDPDVCIGCKACLQACPYDAIHIDPGTGTAAKCHFCAHRVELGLAPACVVVCPEHAIVAGDLDDPDSEIARLVARNEVSVRRPEQGTSPKLFYIDGDAVALVPDVPHAAGAFAFADLAFGHAPPVAAGVSPGRRTPAARRHATADVPLRAALAQGVGAGGGPLYVGQNRFAEQMVQTTFNAQHRVPWHWPVPAYLVTKAVASGVFMSLALLSAIWRVPLSSSLIVAGLLLALASTGATGALLVVDLERPERFLKILTRPQWRSWLTRGAFILIAYGLLLAARLAVEIAAPEAAAATLPLTLTVGAVLAALTAAYTAFLFGQAEGRDMWQSPLLPLHLLIQAVMAGCAALVLAAPLIPPGAFLGPTATLLLAAVALDLIAILTGEVGMPHATASAVSAAERIRRGPHRVAFWWGAIGLGHVVPLVLLVAYQIALNRSVGDLAGEAPAGALGVGAGIALGMAAVAALVGLATYEHVFVTAPQEVPNS